MKIICWNVNGIRANYKKGGFEWLMSQKADIFCVQETKAHPDQLTKDVTHPKGYHAYFDHSKMKKGYSGVAVWTKEKPTLVKYGMGIPDLDKEGRLLELHFKDFVFFNIYFPNGGGGDERLRYKLKFYDAFLRHIGKLRNEGKSIIFCGDVNTAHREIDLARPKENEKNTGFLPIERMWIDGVIASGYVDVYRHFNPNKENAYTYWDMKTFARDRNVGWRIDYFFVSSDLVKSLKNIEIEDLILGSDHCPLTLTLK